MKRILLIIILAASVLSINAQSKFFEECEEIPGITTVYISKTMLSLVGASIGTDDVDISSIASRLESIEIINAENKMVKKLAAKLPEFSKAKGYEELMRVKDDGDNVKLAVKELGKKRYEYVLVAEEPDELSVIIMTGDMPVEDMLKVVKNK